MKIEKLKEVIDLGLNCTNKIAFLGAQVSAHPNFREICELLFPAVLSSTVGQIHIYIDMFFNTNLNKIIIYNYQTYDSYF